MTFTLINEETGERKSFRCDGPENFVEHAEKAYGILTRQPGHSSLPVKYEEAKREFCNQCSKPLAFGRSVDEKGRVFCCLGCRLGYADDHKKVARSIGRIGDVMPGREPFIDTPSIVIYSADRTVKDVIRLKATNGKE